MNEINNTTPGGLLLVGRDPGSEEMKRGKPFCGPSGQLLNNLLSEAGIRRERINITNIVQTQPAQNAFWRHNRGDVERGRAQLIRLLRRLRPSVVVTFGNEASCSIIEGWPTQDGSVQRSYGIAERRGYLWTPSPDCRTKKVLSTLHPAACLVNRDPSGINELLLLRDLKRAKSESKFSELRRIDYDIEIVTRSRAQRCITEIESNSLVACDIETFGPNETACIGFAVSATRAFVFTRKTLNHAHHILLNPRIGKVFQNGQFDLYHLLSRDGIVVSGRIDDTIVGWHTLWPEIAGQRESRKGARRTHKSLAFLESIYGDSPEWWKDYEFSDNREMYELNGKDCCKTFDIWQKISADINREGVKRIYEHERKMIWPCVHIQNRGMLVDERNKKIAVEALDKERKDLAQTICATAEPLIKNSREKLENPSLFFKVVTYSCCRNGKAKRGQCWSCRGFDKSPSKKEMIDKYSHSLSATAKKLSKKLVADLVLGLCEKCDGVGAWETFAFNPSSPAQIAEVLYNVLHLPMRYEKGNLTTNEIALKSILGSLSS